MHIICIDTPGCRLVSAPQHLLGLAPKDSSVCARRVALALDSFRLDQVVFSLGYTETVYRTDIIESQDSSQGATARQYRTVHPQVAEKRHTRPVEEGGRFLDPELGAAPHVAANTSGPRLATTSHSTRTNSQVLSSKALPLVEVDWKWCPSWFGGYEEQTASGMGLLLLYSIFAGLMQPQLPPPKQKLSSSTASIYHHSVIVPQDQH